MAALSDEIHAEYDALDAPLQRCAMLMADHDDTVAEYGPTAPQTKFIREVYAAASVAAAVAGCPVAPLDSLCLGTSLSSGHAPELASRPRRHLRRQLRRASILHLRRLPPHVDRRRRQGKVFSRHLHRARDVRLGVGRTEAT
jgi:hypothetical protein